ncbi:MAG TPA: phasin family protein [Rubricoccaceae bacterium]|jgi:poly(hydroxyalkanoate) granule-associated protein
MATTTKAVKADAKKTKTDTKRVGSDIKKTADDALGLARTTAENVQKDLADTAGSVKESVQSVFLAGLGALSMAEEEGSKLFKKLVKKGEKVDLPGFGADRVQQIRKQLDVATDTASDAVKGRVSDVRYVAGETADKVEDRVTDAVATVMKRIGVPTREEISELTASVERLTKHIDALKEQRAAAPAPAAELTVEAVGGGWYEIRVGTIVVEKVQGKEDAEAALARHQAAQV